ncbi:MAG TPA: hypothetical protein VN634_10590 [Candidatus Limnocylindrales bacterium]|nr:hypothetical protein [Candidatus Limnocylindrales bacterium]
MSRRRIRQAFVRSVALFYLLVACGPSAAAVFCIGNDGHLAIESSLDVCCPPVHSDSAELRAFDDCRGCTDTPVALKAALQKKSDRGDAASPARCIIAAANPVAGANVIRLSTLLRDSIARDLSSTASRRSIVLLI